MDPIVAEMLALDLDDYEYQQDVALGMFGGSDGWDPVPTEDDYDPTPLDQAYNEGDETADLFWSFWSGDAERDIDPRVYRGTHLEWNTLEEYRALNPGGSE